MSVINSKAVNYTKVENVSGEELRLGGPTLYSMAAEVSEEVTLKPGI